MAGLTAQFNDRDIGRFYDKFQKDAEKKFIETLTYAGEQGVRIARVSGKYTDITGNLRSSIGYVVISHGEIIKENYQRADKGSDKDTGLQQANRLAQTLASEFNTGIVLVLVAGMDYALYVESIKGKDVLASAITGTDKFLRETLKKITDG